MTVVVAESPRRSLARAGQRLQNQMAASVSNSNTR
jgi:hypothetical protein